MTVVLVGVVFGTRSAWLGPLVEATAPRVAAHFGVKIQIRSLRGNGTSRLAVQGLALRPARVGALGPLLRLRAEELEAHFSLAAWLGGDPDWLRFVSGRSLDVELDFSAPSPSPAQSDGASGGEPLELQLPALALEESRLLVRFPEGHELEARGLALGANAETGDWDALRAEHLAYRAPGRETLEVGLAASVRLDGRGVSVNELVLLAPDPPSPSPDPSLEDEGDPPAPGADPTGDGSPPETSSDEAAPRSPPAFDLRVGRRGLRASDSRFAWGDATSSGIPGLTWKASLEVFGGRADVSGEATDAALGLVFDLEGIDLAACRADVWPSFDIALAGTARRVQGELALPFDEAAELSGDAFVDLRDLVVGNRDPLDLEGRLSYREGVLRSGRLALTQPENALVLEDLSLPLAKGPSAVLRGGSARVSIDARNLPEWLGRGASEFTVPEHRLELFATLAEGRALVERGRLETPGGALTVRGGTVIARAEGGPTIELDLFADFADLSGLGPILGTAEWAGELEGSLRVAGDWPDVVGSGTLTGTDVTAAGIELGLVEVVVEADRRSVRVPLLRARSTAADIELAGELDVASEELRDVRLRVRVDDLSRIVPWIEVRGNLVVEADVHGGFGALDGSWKLSAYELAVAGHAVERLEAHGALTGYRAHVEALELEAEGGRLALSGNAVFGNSFVLRELEIVSLSAERAGADLALVQPVTLSLEGDPIEIDELPLEGSAGALTLFVRHEDGVMRFGCYARELDLVPLLSPFLPRGLEIAGLTGELEGTRANDELRFTSEGSARRLVLAFDEIVGAAVPNVWSLRWGATFSDQELVLESFEAKSGDVSQVRAAGRFPLDLTGGDLLPKGEVLLKARLNLPELGELARLVPAGVPWPRGTVRADVDLSGEWSALAGWFGVDALDVDLDVGGQPIFRDAQIAGRVVIGERVELERVRVVVPDAFTLQAEGSLESGIDLSRLARGEPLLPGDTAVNFTGGLVIEDSAWIERLDRGMGGDLVRRFGGRMAAELELGGTLDALEPSGQLEFDGGELKLSPELPALESVAGLLNVENRRFEIATMTGELGGSPFSLEGHVDLGSDPPSLDVSLVGRNLLLYRLQGVKVRADANLHVTGSPDAPQISGELRLQDSRLVRRIDFIGPGRRARPRSQGRGIELFSFREPPLARTTFDLNVTAEKPFRIDNNVVDARLRPDLRLLGTGESPELVGTIYVDRGKVVLPAYDLYLRPGTITLGREDPMVPHLELLLGNRIRGYDVSVSVSGPYDDPEILMSSSPPLGEEDLFALVWTGQDPGIGLSSRTGVAGAQAVGVFLAKDILTRFMSDESTESEESFLERFELLIGRDTTQDGDETIEMTYRVSDGFFFGRGSMYLATEQDEYDHVNYGLRFVLPFE